MYTHKKKSMLLVLQMQAYLLYLKKLQLMRIVTKNNIMKKNAQPPNLEEIINQIIHMNTQYYWSWGLSGLFL